MEHVCPIDLSTLKSVGNGTYKCPKCGRYYMETYGGADVKRMDIMMSTSATCPYCDKRVAMSAGSLGDHNTHGGACDGSRRAVSSFDSSGRALLIMSAHVGDRYHFKGDFSNDPDYCRVIADAGQGYLKIKWESSGRESTVPAALLDSPRYAKA